MTTRTRRPTSRSPKTSQTSKKTARPRVKAKALSGSDPVRKGNPRETTGSLLEAQLAFFRAAWALNPMAFMMRQQAAVLESFSPAASFNKRTSTSRRAKGKRPDARHS